MSRRSGSKSWIAIVVGLAACSSPPMTPTPMPPSRSAVGSPAPSADAAAPLPGGWAEVASTGPGLEGSLVAVALAPDGRGVAVGSADRGALLATTLDGVGWRITDDDPAFDDAQLQAVERFGDLFVVGGIADGTTSAVWVGDGSDAWEMIRLPPTGDPSGAIVVDLAVIGTRIVAVGEAIWSSDDARSWTVADAIPGSTVEPPPVPGDDVGCASGLSSIDVVGAELVALGWTACGGVLEIWRSADGVQWDGIGIPLSGNVAMTSAALVNGQLTVYGRRGVDAAAWRVEDGELVLEQEFVAGSAYEVTSVARTDDGYLATIDGHLWTSTSGLHWRVAVRGLGAERVEAVTRVGDRTVAVGKSRDHRPAIWANPRPPHAVLRLPARSEPVGSLGGRWESRAPLPVAGAGAAALDRAGQVQAFGAIDPDTGEPVVQSYDPRTNRWTVRALHAPPVASLVAATVFDADVVVLSWVIEGARLHRYDATGAQLVAIGPPLDGVVPAALLADGDRLVVAGYDLETEAGAVWAIEPGSAEWSRLGDPPGVVDDWTTTGTGEAMAVIGDRAWTYDVEADDWNPKQRSPLRRGEASLVADGSGAVWLIGGFTEGSPDGAVLAYRRDGWASGPDLPTPRLSPAIVRLPTGNVLVIGGWDDGGPVDAVELLRPGT